MTPTRWISSRIACAAVLLTGLGASIPAAAEDVHQIAVYGEVAPRCWVAKPVRTTTNSALPSVGGRAICNQAQPVLVSELRTIGPDGALMAGMPAAAVRTGTSSLSTRAALEIVVTPRA